MHFLNQIVPGLRLALKLVIDRPERLPYMLLLRFFPLFFDVAALLMLLLSFQIVLVGPLFHVCQFAPLSLLELVKGIVEVRAFPVCLLIVADVL